MRSPSLLIPLAYVCCGLFPLLLLPYGRHHREKPGSTGLLVALVGLSIWSIAYGLALTASSDGALLTLGSLVIFGAQLAAVGYLILAVEYTEPFVLTSRLVGGFAAAVGTVQLVSLTDPIHGRLWGEAARPVVDTTTLEPLGSFVVVSTMAVGGAAILLLLADAVTGPGVRRRQSLVLVAAGFPTLLGAVIDVYATEASVYSLLPFGVVIGVFGVAWALFRVDFLDIVPVGRKRIVDEMDDAAVVLDADDRVVECNPAARRIAGVDADYAGMSIERFFDDAPPAVDRFRGHGDVDTELSAVVDGDRHHYHLTISRLEEEEGTRSTTPAGRLVVLRDITRLKRRESALERRETELEFLRQVLTRVLRHNIRNDLTVVRGYAATIEREADDDLAAMASEILETTEGLLETSRKARTIERVITTDDTLTTLDLAATASALVGRYRSTYPEATISLETPDRCLVEADPWLENACEILLENALEHNDGSRPTVELRVERTDAHAAVTIDDDGPGIPADELAVLAQGKETPLEHGSGIGLWIVHWIVERSTASIRFDTDADGTTVVIRIPT